MAINLRNLSKICEFLQNHKKSVLTIIWISSLGLLTYCTYIICNRLESDGEDGITMTILLVCMIFGGYGGVGVLGAFLIIRYACQFLNRYNKHWRL